MTNSNLAIVFGPTLFGQHAATNGQGGVMVDTTYQNLVGIAVVILLSLTFSSRLFRPFWIIMRTYLSTRQTELSFRSLALWLLCGILFHIFVYPIFLLYWRACLVKDALLLVTLSICYPNSRFLSSGIHRLFVCNGRCCIIIRSSSRSHCVSILVITYWIPLLLLVSSFSKDL